MIQVEITEILKIAHQAAHLVMLIYEQPLEEVVSKQDNSPLTKADIEAHTYITHALQKLYPDIPVISEESFQRVDYEERKNWNTFFLVDPLDGTKEFIQRNGEFSINIALIQHGQPVMGVINAPALGLTYYAEKGKGAYKILNNMHTRLPIHTSEDDKIRAVVSRSHCCHATDSYLQNLCSLGKHVSIVSSGSALKFGLIAEGLADVYPRFSPTMEWDTAAGHILVKEIGKSIKLAESPYELCYNKVSLINPSFIVEN